MLATVPAKPSPRLIPFVPDENQKAAIEHVDGPVLVIAGAGTGKTSVLTRRIAQLIQAGHAQASEILALTYTDNAAMEMHERVRGLVPEANVSALQACTFHAYSFGLLQSAGRAFRLLDDQDLWIYLRRHIRDLELKHFVRAANVTQFFDDLIKFMRQCHDELVGPEKYAAYVRRLEQGKLPVPRVTRSKEKVTLSDEEVIERCREIARVFTTVERMLQEQNLGTFSHMITRAYELLRDDPAALTRQQAKARFILVDEFQDVNFAQVKILSLLAGEDPNVFAVGDPDQAIYRFRGASSAAFGLFHNTFAGGGQIVLGKNQRSTTPILNTAFAVINDNPPVFRDTKNGTGVLYRRAPLESAREERAKAEGHALGSTPVEVVAIGDRDLEAPDIAATIREKRRQTRNRWSDFAVLYRQHLHRDDIARELAAQHIPFTIENLDVMETPEVRDVLACLAIVHSTRDAISLVRVAALPQFGIDPHELRSALRARSDEDADVARGLESMLASLRGVSGLLSTLKEARQEIALRGAKVADAVLITARHFSLDAQHPAIQALVGFARRWEEKPLTETKLAGEFLEYLNDFRDARGSIPVPSEGGDAVRLMTAHAAKGLEFNHVFIIRVHSASFPCPYHEALVEFPQDLRDPDSVGEGDSKTLQKEEERRLLYVAMTRARDSLTMFGKRFKGKDPTPPGPLRELLKQWKARQWLTERPARAHQVDLFGAAEPAPAGSRTSEWVTAPPVTAFSRLSATSIERYKTCPLQFKLEREWKLPSDDPAAMQYGSVMHNVLRTYFDAKRQHRPLTDAEVLDLFRVSLEAAAIEDSYQHELYERQGIAQLRDFLATPPSAQVLHTEEVFEMRMGEATVTGRIDRIDDLGNGRVAIVDYKTGKPRSQEQADESLQLSLYALAAQAKWGYRAEELVLYNLEGNSPVGTRRADAELETARVTVDEVMGKIAAGEFDPDPGMHCRFCTYRSLCPATESKMPLPDETN